MVWQSYISSISLSTLPLLANDVVFYFTEMFETIRQELFQFPLLLPTLFFSICITPFFTCSFNSTFTRLLRDLASLFPPLETLPFLLVLFAQHLNTSCPGYCLAFSTALCLQFFREGLMKGQGEKGVMIMTVNSGCDVSWGLLRKGKKVKPERKW